MATITKPMALDESFNTTESTSRNQADVLAGIEQAIVRGFGQVANAVSYDNTDSGLTADNVQDAIDEVDDNVDGLVDDVAEISSDIESTKTATGNPITLTDAAPINAESLVVELEPKQDLHGQSAPYVGGARKNLLPLTVDGIKEANTSYGTWSGNAFTNNGVTFTILTDNNGNVTGIKADGTPSSSSHSWFYLIGTPTSFANTILNGCPSGGGSGRFEVQTTVDTVRDYGSGVSITSSSATLIAIGIRYGYTASNLLFKPMIRLSTETDPTFEPYSNICPITGYTECEVDDVGKNRVEEAISDTSIDVDGAIVSDSRYDMCIAKVKQGVQYVVTTNDGGLVAGFFKEKPTSGSVSYNGARVDVVNTTFTASIDGYIAFRTYADYATPQCEEGSTATTYEPYHSSNATIQFGQTVYGGKSNFTDGGTSDTYENVDLGDLSWAYDSTYERFGARVSNVNKTMYTTEDMLCSCFKPDYSPIAASGIDGTIAIFREGDVLVICKEYTDASTFRTAMTGQTVCYKKATPTQLSTPPTDLKLLKGTNHITTNGTTINLGYQPDNVIGDVKGEIEKCAVDAEFMQFTDGTDTFTDVNLSLDASLHTVSVVGSKIEQKRFICFEVMDKMGGVLQGILASCIAFTDGAKTPSGTAFRAYIESLQMYVNFRIYGSGGSYTLAYQSETSFSTSAFFVRVRMMNNL